MRIHSLPPSWSARSSSVTCMWRRTCSYHRCEGRRYNIAMTASEERSPFLFCHIIHFPAKYTSVNHMKVSHRAKQKQLTLYDIETKEQQVYQMDDSCACIASAMTASFPFTASAMISLCCSAESLFSSGKTPQSADRQWYITGAAGHSTAIGGRRQKPNWSDEASDQRERRLLHNTAKG